LWPLSGHPLVFDQHVWAMVTVISLSAAPAILVGGAAR